MNPLAAQTQRHLANAFPDWERYFGICGQDDFEAAIPAPAGSGAGHLVIFTDQGKYLWIRFSSPYMCYLVDDMDEMIGTVQGLIRNEICMVTVTETAGDAWVETTLCRPTDRIPVQPGRTARIISWSGDHDRTL